MNILIKSLRDDIEMVTLGIATVILAIFIWAIVLIKAKGDRQKVQKAFHANIDSNETTSSSTKEMAKEFVNAILGY